MHGNKLFPFQIESIQVGTEKQTHCTVVSIFIFEIHRTWTGEDGQQAKCMK